MCLKLLWEDLNQSNLKKISTSLIYLPCFPTLLTPIVPKHNLFLSLVPSFATLQEHVLLHSLTVLGSLTWYKQKLTQVSMATSKHTTIFFQGVVKMAGVRCVVGLAFCPADFHTEPNKVSCSVYLARLPHTRARISPSGIQNAAYNLLCQISWQQLIRNTSGASY